MGVKFLSLNMISWSWFELFKNQFSCIQLHSPQPVPSCIKLVDSDGLVKIYHRPIYVSQLMLEFPKHLVCRSDSFFIGQKIPPLSENNQLQLGQKYFLLPRHYFQSALSFVTIASFAQSQPQQHSNILPPNSDLSNNNGFFKKASSCQQPFVIQRTPSGCLRIRVSDDFISRLLEQGKITSSGDVNGEVEAAAGRGRICTTPQLVKEYNQLVRRRKWKPQLETIREGYRIKRLSSFGLKRTKKKKTTTTPRSKLTASHGSTISTSLRHRLSSMKFPSNPKFRIK